MSLLDTDRKVRKIRELLRGETDPALGARLATDYAEAVRATQLRLQQCETMIQAGDFPQAIQLAETTPNLLDMVTVLEFRESHEWRRFCQEKQLVMAEPLDTRAVQVLNDCYAKGISTDHPLYTQFRKAMMSRDDAGALRALRSILRLNPNDQNAATEFDRLDAKVLTARIAALNELLAHGSSEEIQTAVTEIEEAGFKTPPDGPVWRHAQLHVALRVLSRAAWFHDAGDWTGVIDTLDLMRSLVAEHKLTLPANAVVQLESLDGWLHIQRERQRREMKMKALQTTAWSALRASENKDVNGQEIKIREIAADLESLENARFALERGDNPVPEQLTTRLKDRCRDLEGALGTRRRRRSIVIAVGLVAIISAISSVGYLFWYQHRVQSVATELNSLVRNREVERVEDFIRQLEKGESRLLASVKLQLAEKEAKSFVEKELQIYADYTASFGQLPTEFKNDQLEATQSQIKQMADKLALVAPVFRSQETRRADDYQERWSRFLETRRQALNGAFEPLLRELEQRVEAAVSSQESSPVRESIPLLVEKVRNLNELVDVPSLRVQVQPGWRARFTSAGRKVETQRQRIESYDQALGRLYITQNLEEFKSALTLISNSGFQVDKEVQAAMSVRQVVPTGEDFLASLLLPNDIETARALKLKPQAEFVPKTISPKAAAIFQELRSQPAFSPELVRYRLYLDVPKRTRQVDWITVGPLRKAPGWETILAFTTDAGASHFDLLKPEYASFDGKSMTIALVNKNLLVEVEEKGLCREAGSFQTFRLGHMLGGSVDETARPLLKVLDDLRASQEGSPLARAYLLLQVIRLMEEQPADWGLPFAQIVQEWQRHLTEAGADKIRPGDWFIPERIASSEVPIAKALAALRSTSCAEQANRLSSLIALTLKSGMSLVGYIALDGQPKFTSASLPADIWGVSASSRKPGLLYRNRGKVSIASGLPLSPLLKLNESPSTLQSQAQVNSDDKEFLPPLFKLATEIR